MRHLTNEMRFKVCKTGIVKIFWITTMLITLPLDRSLYIQRYESIRKTENIIILIFDSFLYKSAEWAD